MSSSKLAAFCRDCLADIAVRTTRCPSCGSPGLVRHPELAALHIAHIDCDAFYASIEKRSRPELRDKPLIVGGGTRGVVATACYNARIRGVKSAMPMYRALRLCPNAVVIKPDMKKYAAVGRRIRDMMQAVTPLVQPLSIDEAFLDLSGTERLHKASPALVLARLQNRIQHELGITVSVGLSYNKFLAKIASDYRKPRGFSVIGRGDAISFLQDKPVSLIWGIGAVAAARLAAEGFTTIGQLQQLDANELTHRFGATGERLFSLSRGIDLRPVEPRGRVKSISSETTFDRDLTEPTELLRVLRRLADKAGERLKMSEFACQTVVLKLRTAKFKTRTRHRRLHSPTRLADRIFGAGRDLLEKEADGTSYRLIGIGCVDLCPAGLADPTDLADPNAARKALAEAARDRIRARFGATALETGYTFRGSDWERPSRS